MYIKCEMEAVITYYKKYGQYYETECVSNVKIKKEADTDFC